MALAGGVAEPGYVLVGRRPLPAALYPRIRWVPPRQERFPFKFVNM